MIKPDRRKAILEIVGYEGINFTTDDDGNILEWDRSPKVGSDSDEPQKTAQPSDEDIDAKLTELEAEWTAQDYARKREVEYPSIAELTIAMYDTDDKAALETKRAAVKTKWPKDNSGPVE